MKNRKSGNRGRAHTISSRLFASRDCTYLPAAEILRRSFCLLPRGVSKNTLRVFVVGIEMLQIAPAVRGLAFEFLQPVISVIHRTHCCRFSPLNAAQTR